jgi:hypothetical protein
MTPGSNRGIAGGDARLTAAAIQRRAERDAEVRHQAGDPLMFGVRVAILRVTEVHDNYLVCGTTNVAKYPEVQKAEYHGYSTTDPVDGGDVTYSYTGAQERTVTKGSDTEDQRIVPWYIPAGGSFLGSRIVCVQLTTTVLNDGGSDLVCPWLEVTNRAWAKV